MCYSRTSYYSLLHRQGSLPSSLIAILSGTRQPASKRLFASGCGLERKSRSMLVAIDMEPCSMPKLSLIVRTYGRGTCQQKEVAPRFLASQRFYRTQDGFASTIERRERACVSRRCCCSQSCPQKTIRGCVSLAQAGTARVPRRMQDAARRARLVRQGALSAVYYREPFLNTSCFLRCPSNFRLVK